MRSVYLQVGSHPGTSGRCIRVPRPALGQLGHIVFRRQRLLLSIESVGAQERLTIISLFMLPISSRAAASCVLCHLLYQSARIDKKVTERVATPRNPARYPGMNRHALTTCHKKEPPKSVPVPYLTIRSIPEYPKLLGWLG